MPIKFFLLVATGPCLVDFILLVSFFVSCLSPVEFMAGSVKYLAACKAVPSKMTLMLW